MGAAKICKKPWPNNRRPSWMVERCFNNFGLRLQNEMREMGCVRRYPLKKNWVRDPIVHHAEFLMLTC